MAADRVREQRMRAYLPGDARRAEGRPVWRARWQHQNDPRLTRTGRLRATSAAPEQWHMQCAIRVRHWRQTRLNATRWRAANAVRLQRELARPARRSLEHQEPRR